MSFSQLGAPSYLTGHSLGAASFGDDGPGTQISIVKSTSCSPSRNLGTNNFLVC